MSKQNNFPSNPPLSWGEGILIQRESPKYLIGRLLTLVDALGLKESQEKSVKDLVQQEVWSLFSGESVQYVATEINDRIREFYQNWKKKNAGSLIPVSFGKLKVIIEEIKD